jgi:hypothetical protein
VTKRAWGVTWAIALIVGYASHGIVGLAAAALLVFVPFFLSCRFSPRARHGSCKGTGEVRSKIMPWSFHKCHGCTGGRHIRHGARVLGTAAVKAEHEKALAGRKTAKDQNRWR